VECKRGERDWKGEVIIGKLEAWISERVRREKSCPISSVPLSPLSITLIRGMSTVELPTAAYVCERIVRCRLSWTHGHGDLHDVDD
jgi:hypothetical protein